MRRPGTIQYLLKQERLGTKAESWEKLQFKKVNISTRMSTAASLRLPAIQHPLSRLGDPELISLRGYSRDGSRDGCWMPKRRIRPQSPDRGSLDSAFRSQSSLSSISSIMEKRRGVDIPQQIPEGDEAIYNSDKPKLSAYRESQAWILRNLLPIQF